MSPCFRWFLPTPSSFCRSLCVGSALTLLFVVMPMPHLNLYLCNFSKFPPSKPIYNVLRALDPGERLTTPWPKQAAPTAQLLHPSTHFLTFSVIVLQSWEERYTNISGFTSSFSLSFFFFPSGTYKNWHQFYSCSAESSALPLSESPPLCTLQPCAAPLFLACRLSGLWFTHSSVLVQHLI